MTYNRDTVVTGRSNGELIDFVNANGTGGSSGITSINADTAAAQTIVAASTGTDFTVATLAGVTTLAIPSASAANRGLVTTGVQTFAGAKTFSAAVTGTLGFVGDVTGNVSGTSGSTTGNAATATALANSRNIWGQAFTGAANVTGAMTGVTTIVMTGLLTITQGTVNTAIVASTGYSLTGSDATGMVSLAGTWNTSGTPTAISLAITNTASNAASLLMNLAAGAGGVTSRFSVDVLGNAIVGNNLTISAGNLTLTSGSTITGNNVSQLTIANAGLYAWSGRGGVNAPSDGVIQLNNNSQNGFTRMNWGGGTTSFPALSFTGINTRVVRGDGTTGANLGMGAVSPGTSAVNVLYFSNASTAPSTSTDLVHLYASDISAGNAALTIFQEAAIRVGLVTGTHSVPTIVNGTTLYLIASNV